MSRLSLEFQPSRTHSKLKEPHGHLHVRKLWNFALQTMVSVLTRNTWIASSQCFNDSTDEVHMKVRVWAWQYVAASSNDTGVASLQEANLTVAQPSSLSYPSSNIKEQ